MNRINEINERLAAIANECETATGEALTALENEANALTEERTRLMAEVEARAALRSRIAAGAGTAVPVHPAAAPATQADPQQSRQAIAEQESRSFSDFIRGVATQMRTDPVAQNFNMENNGAIIPESIAARIIERVRDLCPILAGAEVYHVNGVLKIPVYGDKVENDNHHNIGVAYASDFNELAADAGAFTSVDLSGYLMGSLTLIGRTVLNNANFDLTSFVVEKMADQIATFIEGELLNGSGSGHCTGALSTPNTLNAGSTSAISADKLIELQAKIKQVFQSGACWTMHPDTFTSLKKLKDGNGRYLIQDDFTSEFPYRLLGKPVHLSDNMPVIASGAKAILYGDYKGLSVNIREAVSIEVLREKYATQHAIGIVGWLEMDSKVTDAQKLVTLTMSV